MAFRGWAGGRVLLALSLGPLGACEADREEVTENLVAVVSAEEIDVLARLDGVTRVVDLLPTPDGRVWILNSQPPYFTVIGPSGDVQLEFGEQGGGPRELDRPVVLVGMAESTDVWAYDWVRNALIQVSPDNREVVAIPQDTIPVPSLVSFRGAGINPAPPWFEGSADGFFFSRARTAQPESALHPWSADILRISTESAAVELAAPLADRLGDPQSRFGGATVLMPYPLWSTCSDGAIGFYDPLGPALRRLSPNGDEVDPIALPESRPVTMTPDLVFEMFFRQFAEDRPSGQTMDMENMRRLTEEQNQEFVRNSSEHFPEYSELRCDARGEFWLRRFDPTTGRLGLGPDWLRVSADGAHASVSLPAEFRVFRIERDRMWGTLRDSLGVESLAAFDLSGIRPGGD